MPHSMTGFGRCEKARDGRAATVEVRTVNHRHLVFKWRMPGRLARVEARLEEIARESLARGSVEVQIRGGAKARAEIRVDVELAKRYGGAVRELSGDEPDWTAILQLPGVVVVEDDEGLEAEEVALVESAFAGAIAGVVAMRKAEGERLVVDLESLLDEVEATSEKLGKRAAKLPNLARERIGKRLEELLAGSRAPLDAGLLERETALIADRSDVREELTRLASHVAALRATLRKKDKKDAIGRALDFTVQELAREANTAGAKLLDAEASKLVVKLKTAIERLREQVQNIE
jgi:uncharacterized protein (TIGR00255 family)